MSKKKYLIIGASAAGLSAAHKIRQLDSTGSIQCLTYEKDVYNKCFLADFLASHKEYPAFKSEDFFVQNSIDLITESRVIKIDREGKIVINEQGAIFEYDALLLAHGGSIVRPESVTAVCHNVFDFYTFAQTRLLKEYAMRQSTKTILIIGAGLSGVECADALVGTAKKIIMVERSAGPLSHQITPDAWGYVQRLMNDNGIIIRCNLIVQYFTISVNQVVAVTLSDGSVIEVDMIIYALGAQPHHQLPREAGLMIESNLIVVDEYLQTSDSAIWAAGDVCRIYNSLTQSYVKSCTWPDAMQQGMCAASNMAGIVKKYGGASPVISSAFFGKKFFVAGSITPRCADDEIKLTVTESEYLMVMVRYGIVQGFILMGDNRKFFGLKHSLVTQTRYQTT